MCVSCKNYSFQSEFEKNRVSQTQLGIFIFRFGFHEPVHIFQIPEFSVAYTRFSFETTDLLLILGAVS